MRPAATHALDDGFKRDINFQHVVELDTSGLHGICLGNGAWKAVKQKTFVAVRLGDALLDEIDDEVVTDERSRVHDLFGLNPQWRSGLHGCAQHVTG